MKNKLFAFFSSNPTYPYPVVEGSTYNDEFSETLDSFNIILDNIDEAHRLINLQPYEFVKIVNLGENGITWRGKNYIFMLIDNYYEKENNITQHIFQYTINLMSETKFLEKIQCPNLCITHSFVTGQKTIIQYINQYLELYCPKVKFTDDGVNWSYRRLFSVDLFANELLAEDLERENVSINRGYNEINPSFYLLNSDGTVYQSLEFVVEHNDYIIRNLTEDVTFTFNGFEIVTIDGRFYTVNVVLGPGEEYTVGSAAPGETIFNLSRPIDQKYPILVSENALTDFYKKFNVLCADMSLSAPTLRQLLSSLMAQVGCIPVVRKRKLSYLDLREKGSEFVRNNTINYIQKSMSSDSFVNTLTNYSSQVLDSGNEVISETIGFRDKNNALIKQLSNMKLETKFPIYKVTEFYMDAIINRVTSIAHTFISSWQKEWVKNNVDGGGPMTMVHGSGDGDGSVQILLLHSVPYQANGGYTYRIQNATIHCCKVNLSGENVIGYEQVAILNVSNSIVAYPSAGGSAILKDANGNLISNTRDDFYLCDLSFGDSGQMAGARMTVKSDDVDILSCDFFWIEANIKPYHVMYLGNNEYRLGSEATPLGNPSYCISWWYTQDKATYPEDMESERYHTSTYFYGEYDLTPLCVENSKRQLLETNFNNMPSSGTIADLAKWYYGTVGYSIGAKEIVGFSQQYTKTVQSGIYHWNETYTFIENIINYIIESNGFIAPTKKRYLNYISTMNPGGYPESFIDKDFGAFIPQDIYHADGDSGDPEHNFASLLFTVRYQPLNSYTLKYAKEINEIPLEITQLDSAENGISDFDRLSFSEQDKVNRLGNDVISINQVTDNIADLKPVNSYYNDYTIFKRTIAIHRNCLQVNYSASKNYVIKNFFTSIITKYRAYEYVNYNSSVIRKENDNIYVLISENTYLDGDDKISALDKEKLINGVVNKNNNDNRLKYVIQYAKDNEGIDRYCKNDISVIANKNILAFVSEDYDNVSAGTYFLNDGAVDTDLGGVMQKWQIWGDSYFNSHEIIYSSNIYYTPENFNNVYMLPVLDGTFYNPIYNLFRLRDNKQTYKKTVYKDNAEIINRTVQFTFYNDSGNVIWTENFITQNSLYGDLSKQINGVICSRDFNVNNDAYVFAGTINNNVTDFVSIGTEDGLTFIEIDWSQWSLFTPAPGPEPEPDPHNTRDIIPTLRVNSVIKFVYTDGSKTYDIIAFKNPTGTSDRVRYYVSLNDTKTTKVMAEIQSGNNAGLVYYGYKCVNDATNRNVEEI